MNGFYLNFCLHLEQANGFHLYSCKLTTFCMQDVCYQFDKVCPSTQPEWMANNSDGQLLLGLLFTLVAGECFSFILLYLSTLYSVCSNSPLYHFLCSNNSVNPSFPTGKGKYLLLCFLESKSLNVPLVCLFFKSLIIF